MPLKKLTGTRNVVNWQVDMHASVDAPAIVVQDTGRANFKSLGARLLAITAITDETQLDRVRAAATALSDSDDAIWSAADAQKILDAAGTAPSPTHVTVETLAGQMSLLFRAARPGTAGGRLLRYRKGSTRPELSILTVLRQEGMIVPKGTDLEVPVKLVEDSDGLTLLANFRRATAHNAEGEPPNNESPTT